MQEGVFLCYNSGHSMDHKHNVTDLKRSENRRSYHNTKQSSGHCLARWREVKGSVAHPGLATLQEL